MGVFSTRKKIYVSSSPYHMSGPEEDRSNYLKSSLFSAVISSHDQYLGETVVRNYLTGPGIRQRQFQSWARRNQYSGLPTLEIQRQLSVDSQVVKPYIPVPVDPPGLVTEVQISSISDGDYSIFAEQWIMENNPAAVNTDYVIEYFESDHTITIQYVGGMTDTFDAGIYDKDKQFISANYYHYIPESVQDLVVGDETVDSESAPDETGYLLVSSTNTDTISHVLSYAKTVTKTYSDSTPTVGPTTTPHTDHVDHNTTDTVLTKTEYVGGSGGSETSDLESTLHVSERRVVVNRVSTMVETNDLGNGVIETITTEIDGDHLDPIYTFRVDTQETIKGEVIGGDKLWIYEIGTGITELDALSEVVENTDHQEFLPFIPIRLDNKSLRHKDFDDDTGNGLYESSRIAYRKVTSGLQTIETLLDEIEDNEDIDEIDYAFIVYGGTLNSGEPSVLRYMYRFFSELIPFQDVSPSYMDEFKAAVAGYSDLEDTLEQWGDAQVDVTNPLYGTEKPVLPSLASPELTTMKLVTDNTQTAGYDMRISWVSINEEILPGLGRPDAKKGDVWFEQNGKFQWDQFHGGGGFVGGIVADRISEANAIEETGMFYQVSDTEYKKLTMHGLIHQNYVYKGKSVDITAHEALQDDEVSGFIVPLSTTILKSMGLVDATQMSLANTFIVFNSYTVVRKKWYSGFIGTFLIVITVLVISVLVNPTAFGGLSGALGTNAAVGASLGFTGTGAIIAGAVSNALAAIVISSLVGVVTTEIFGEKYGAIVGAIATYVTTAGLASGFSNITVNTMLTPQNLLAFGSALSNGYTGFVQADIAQMQTQLAADQVDFDKQLKEINDMIRDLGGSNDLSFDPMQLTDVNAGNGQGTGSYIPESLDEFIHRTTMTGSDIVDITLSLVENYADLNLELPQT